MVFTNTPTTPVPHHVYRLELANELLTRGDAAGALSTFDALLGPDTRSKEELHSLLAQKRLSWQHIVPPSRVLEFVFPLAEVPTSILSQNPALIADAKKWANVLNPNVCCATHYLVFGKSELEVAARPALPGTSSEPRDKHLVHVFPTLPISGVLAAPHRVTFVSLYAPSDAFSSWSDAVRADFHVSRGLCYTALHLLSAATDSDVGTFKFKFGGTLPLAHAIASYASALALSESHSGATSALKILAANVDALVVVDVLVKLSDAPLVAPTSPAVAGFMRHFGPGGSPAPAPAPAFAPAPAPAPAFVSAPAPALGTLGLLGGASLGARTKCLVVNLAAPILLPRLVSVLKESSDTFRALQFIKALRELSRILPSPGALSVADITGALCAVGAEFLRGGYYDRALEMYTEASTLFPSSIPARSGVLDALRSLGRWDAYFATCEAIQGDAGASTDMKEWVAAKLAAGALDYRVVCVEKVKAGLQQGASGAHAHRVSLSVDPSPDALDTASVACVSLAHSLQAADRVICRLASLTRVQSLLIEISTVESGRVTSRQQVGESLAAVRGAEKVWRAAGAVATHAASGGASESALRSLVSTRMIHACYVASAVTTATAAVLDEIAACDNVLQDASPVRGTGAPSLYYKLDEALRAAMCEGPLDSPGAMSLHAAVNALNQWRADHSSALSKLLSSAPERSIASVVSSASALVDGAPSLASIGGGILLRSAEQLSVWRSDAARSLSETAQDRERLNAPLADLRQLQAELSSENSACEAMCSVVRGAPAARDAVKEARRALRAAQRAVEDAHEEGRPLPPDTDARLDRLKTGVSKAEAVLEAQAAVTAVHAAAGLAEAVAFRLSLVTPPPPAPSGVPTSSIEFYWAQLVSAGLAVPRSAASYRDAAPLSHSTGLVSRAVLRGTDEHVVLKRFPLAAGSAAFLNEVSLLRVVDHPNVIAVQCVWRDESFYVLQFPFIEGGALPDWLAAAPRSFGDRLRLFRGVVRGVAYLHAQRIVHRDLKPTNILVGGDGAPRLCDLGISLGLDSALMTTLGTTAGGGAGAGTEAYKSPEQLRRERAAPASDIYALGLILYELVVDAPYPLEPHQRREASIPPALPSFGATDAPEVIAMLRLGATHASAELTLSLLRLLLAPNPGDRPSSHAVLANPLMDDVVERGGSGKIPAASARAHTSVQTPAQLAVALGVAERAVRRALTAPRPTPTPIPVSLQGAAAPDRIARLEAAFVELAVSSAPACVTSDDSGAAISTDRLADALFTGVIAPSRGLFTVSTEDGAQTSLLPSLGATREQCLLLQGVGAALASAARDGHLVDAVPRLPELMFDVLLVGHEALSRGASLSSLLRHLAAWDADLARNFTYLLASPVKGNTDSVELRDGRGVSVPVTEANKEAVLREQVCHALLSSRARSWDALRAGFMCVGGGGEEVGNAVSVAAAAEGVPPSSVLRNLLYGSASRRAAADDAASVAAIRAAGAQPCPKCGVQTVRFAGCPHMTCPCGQHWNWAGYTPVDPML